MTLWLKKDIYYRVCNEEEIRTNKAKASMAIYGKF